MAAFFVYLLIGVVGTAVVYAVKPDLFADYIYDVEWDVEWGVFVIGVFFWPGALIGGAAFLVVLGTHALGKQIREFVYRKEAPSGS